MSIWPLIDAGEFATISEGLTEADAALSQGKWAQYIQGLMDKIPAKAGTVGRYAFITRDTALFQGMARVMQYGDFLGKAVLYDHLAKQGQTKAEALKGVSEEFVNYNLLPGRSRSYADGMGLTWFWAFKLRAIKVALGHIRNHPFRALMLSVGNPLIPEVPGMTLGSPIEDNMLSVVGDGRLGYSIGPGMAFNAPSLHQAKVGRHLRWRKADRQVWSESGRSPRSASKAASNEGGQAVPLVPSRLAVQSCLTNVRQVCTGGGYGGRTAAGGLRAGLDGPTGGKRAWSGSAA